MRPLTSAVAISLATLALGSSVGATAKPYPARQHCPSRHGIVASGRPARFTLRCTGNLMATVTINGTPLQIVDVTSHAQTATFYGQGSVVRIHQTRTRISVLVVSVWRIHYRVSLTHTRR